MSEQILTTQPPVEAFEPEAILESSAQVYAQVILTVTDGHCYLGRDAFPVGHDDFVGLYENGNINEPTTGRLAWNYCKWTNYPYKTGVIARTGYVAMYWAYNALEGKFNRLAVTPALTSEIIESGGSVSKRTTC